MFGEFLEKGIDLQPTIAITQAHLTLPEIHEAIEAGRLDVDGEFVTETCPDDEFDTLCFDGSCRTACHDNCTDQLQPDVLFRRAATGPPHDVRLSDECR